MTLSDVRPIRVMFAIDSLAVGGTETNLLRVALQLDRERCPVTVVYARPGALLARLQAAGVPVVQRLQPSFKSPSLWRAVREYRAWLTDHAVDVLHTHDVYSNLFGALAYQRSGPWRLLVSRRWGIRQYSRALHWANRWAFGRADLVLGNSASVGRSLADDEGVARDKIVVIPNFADDAVFAPTADPAALRAELRVPAEAMVIGIIANLSPVKNHGLLLDAVAAWPASLRAPHLVLIGDGPERPALEARAAALGLRDRVHFAGLIPQASRYHAAFDVSVLTSHSEGFPNTLVEAMAAGRPVVATDVGGVRDAVVDGTTGFIVPAGDVAALTERLARLVADPALRARMGAAGARHANAEFRAATVLPKLEAVYRRLVALRPAISPP